MSTVYEAIYLSSISIAQQITATLRSYWKWWIMYEENERLQKLLDSVDVKPRRRGIESYSAHYYNARRVKEEATNVAKKMLKIQRETEKEETLAEKHRIILAEERHHLTLKIIGLAMTYVRVKYELPSESGKK